MIVMDAMPKIIRVSVVNSPADGCVVVASVPGVELVSVIVEMAVT